MIPGGRFARTVRRIAAERQRPSSSLHFGTRGKGSRQSCREKAGTVENLGTISKGIAGAARVAAALVASGRRPRLNSGLLSFGGRRTRSAGTVVFMIALTWSTVEPYRPRSIRSSRSSVNSVDAGPFVGPRLDPPDESVSLSLPRSRKEEKVHSENRNPTRVEYDANDFSPT